MLRIDRRTFVQKTALALVTAGSAAYAAPLAVLPEDDLVATFLAAVREGDVTRVAELLDRSPELLTASDDAGRSAFVIAALGGRDAVCAELRKRGLELDLVEAVLAQDWERAETLVGESPKLATEAHPIGGTPLYAAALGGVEPMWRVRRFGMSPDLAPEGGSGFTPARAAIAARTEGLAIRALSDLCGNGADVNAPQRGGDSVLHGAVARKSTALVRVALRKGAVVDSKDAAGRTPLALAESLEWGEGVRLLKDHASVPRDHRASRWAFDANREPIERVVLDDVDQAKQNDVSGASHVRFDETAAFLKEDGRLIWSVSVDDELAIEACGHIGQRRIIALHLEHGAPYSLPTAASNGDQEHVRWLLDRDPKLIHERGAHDFPMMWYPVMGGGDVEMAELLKSRGASVDQESMGSTALHWWAGRGGADLAKWLIENGADVDALTWRWDGEGERPLDVARRREAKDIEKLLVDAGAKSAKG